MKGLMKRISAILLALIMVLSMEGTSKALTFGQGATADNGWTTTDTLPSVTGLSEDAVYSADWLLANENVFALGDTPSGQGFTVAFSHMLGPTITKGGLKSDGGFYNYLTNNGYNYLHSDANSLGDMTTVLYEQKEEKNPFYVGLNSTVTGDVNSGFSFDNKKVGNGTNVYRTNSFVDFNVAAEKLKSQSKKLLEAAKNNAGTVRITTANVDKYIKTVGNIPVIIIEIGTNVIIDDEVMEKMLTNQLRASSFMLAGDFQSSTPTIINITKGGEWKMPGTYVYYKGKTASEAISLQSLFGYNGDVEVSGKFWYSEKGTNVVWNIVNAEKITYATSSGTDMMGHLFAPNADISGATGSVNGGFVCKSVNLPTTEAHMFPMNAKFDLDNLIVPAQEVIVKAKKELHDGEQVVNLAGSRFQFRLESLSNNAKHVIQTEENDDSGNIVFDTLSFNKEGRYEYTLKEISGTDPTMIYDSTEYVVIVDIVKGQSPNVVYYKDGKQIEEEPVFKNEKINSEAQYDPVNVTIEATKELRQQTLSGGKEPLQADQFTFVLKSINPENTENTENSEEKKNDESGKITFSKEYTQPGIYEYILEEKTGGDSAVTYDKTEHTVKVKVTRKKNTNQLEAKVLYTTSIRDTVPPVFKNIRKYDASECKATIQATKELEGADLTNNQFEFELIPDVSNPVNEGRKVAENIDGKVTFEKSYSKIGTYNYTLREVKGEDPKIEYDQNRYRISVEVTADTDSGKLVASPPKYRKQDGSDVSNITFKNKMKTEQNPTPITVAISASKIIKDVDGRDLQIDEYNNQFEFSLRVAGETRQKKIKNNNGNVEFSKTYTKAGTYNYILKEVKGTDSTIQYDNEEYKVTVKIVEEDNKLKLDSIQYRNSKDEEISSIEFVNKKKAPTPIPVSIEATKKLLKSGTSTELSMDEHNGKFEFELTNTSNEEDKIPVKNQGGNVKFSKTYTEAGTFTYTLKEKKGEDPTVTYDDTTYEVQVKVVNENGQLKPTVTYKKVGEGSSTIVQKPEFSNEKVIDGNEKINKTVKIEWKNDLPSKRPERVEVILYKDDEEGPNSKVEIVKDEDGNYEYTWTNLEKYNENGAECVYTVKEVVPNKYEQLDSKEENGVTVITNTQYVKKTVVIKWKNDLPTDRPDKVEVQLKQGDTVWTAKNVKVKKDAHGRYEFTWTDLPRCDASGKEYAYTATQTVPDKYTQDSVEEQDGKTIITNTQKVDKTVVIEWEADLPADRPNEVEVQLKQNGNVMSNKDQTITKNGEGKYEFIWEDLPKCDEDGNPYVYTVTQTVPDKYAELSIKEENGKTVITNTQKVDKTVVIEWVGDLSTDRPSEVEVQLKQNGNVMSDKNQTITKTEEGKYELTWEDLPRCDASGKEYAYTATQTVPDKYAEISVVEQDGKTIITNTQEISKTVVIEWVNDNPDERPENVEVQLLQNNNKLNKDAVVTVKDGKYIFTWEDLPKCDENGNPYQYTATETIPDKYTQVSVVEQDGKTIITNTQNLSNVWKKVEIKWEGDDPKTRPNSVKVQLYNDGIPVGKVIEVVKDADGNYVYTWENLPKYKPGTKTEIIYTVEQVLPKYYKEISHKEEKTGTIITNGKDDSIVNDGETVDKPEVPVESDNSAKTGDSMNLFVWIIFIFALLLACLLLVIKKYKY